MNYWYFQPILDSYFVVAVSAAALVLVLLLAPAPGRVSRGQRACLAALRGLVILLVVFAMLRPTYVSTKSRPETSTLVVLCDRSRSMNIADAADGTTRWQAQREAIANALPVLREMREDIEVLIYAFDSEARGVAFDGDDIRLGAKPVGDQSDIGTSLDDVIRNTAGKRLAALILLSDGSQRALKPRVDLQQPARELARLGYPLYSVPLGLSRDQAQARDVAIESLPDQYTVFVKNELEIHAQLRSQGYVNQEIETELLVESAGGQRETIGPITLRPTSDGQRLEVRFTYIPEKPGQYKLTIQAAEQPGELVTSNNRLSAFLTVLDGGLRVLYLYGSIVSGQRFECESIDSSPDIQLDHQWVDHRRRTQWPIELAPGTFDDVYDVFLLGDLDASALGPQNCRALAQATAQGKGLMMLGGYHSFGPGGYRDTALANVLPVLMGRHELQRFGAPRRADRHLNRELVIRPTRPHFITHLRPGAQNGPAWRRLPPLPGANRFGKIRDTRAEILLETTDGDPILVASRYGQGRVLAMAVDSLAPWYRHGFSSEHKRFWRQAILWLAQKEDTMSDGVWIRLDQRRFSPGGRVTFAVGANGPEGDPLLDVTFQATVLDPNGEQDSARLSPEGQQWTGAFDKLETPGDYLLEVVGRRDGQVVGSAQRKFMVMDQDLELIDPAANPQQLEQLSRLTSQAGGKTIAPEQLPGLLRQIKDSPPPMEIEVQSKWQLAESEFDAWIFFLCVVGLLSGEWCLRKKWRLV